VFKKLHILVLKAFIPPFLAAFFVSVFVLILQFLWLYIDELVGKGLEFWVIAKLLFYASLQVVPMATPIAVMLASIMTFGNMGEHFELTALKSSGISLMKIFKPVIFASALIAMGNFFFANNVLPYANLKLSTLLFDVRQQHPALNFQKGIFNYDLDGYVIRIGDKSKNTAMMYDFLIYDHKNAKFNDRVIVADSGTIKVTDDFNYLVLNLYNGCQYDEMPEEERDLHKRKFPHREDFFSKYTVVVKLEGFQFKETDMSLLKHNYDMLNVLELNKKIDSLKTAYRKRQEYYVRIMENSLFFRQKVKLRSHKDTLENFAAFQTWEKIDPKDLPVIFDVDSAIEAQSYKQKVLIYRDAIDLAKKVDNQLKIASMELDSKRAWIAKHEISMYRKLTLSLACLLFFFIGGPLGAIIRKGGFGLPTIISVLIFMLYYVISIFSEKLIAQGVMSASFGMWISSVFLIILGAYLAYSAAHDKVITNIDYYLNKLKDFSKKIGRLFVKKKFKGKK